MSIHTDRAYNAARGIGAAAASSYETWETLVAMPKRELAEIAMHLGALATGDYDFALGDGAALARVLEERDSLKSNGLI